MDFLLQPYEYFGTSRSTISKDEKAAGMTSAFPIVSAANDRPPLYDEATSEDVLSVIFESHLQLVVEGQGTVAIQVTPSAESELRISLTQTLDQSDDNMILELELATTSAKFFEIKGQTKKEIPSTTPKGLQAALLVPNVPDLYWLSVDKKNGCLRYGKTYRSASLTYLKAEIEVGDVSTKPGPYIWIKSLKYVGFRASGPANSLASTSLGQFSIGHLPIVNDLPPVVAESVDVTLEDLAVGTTTSIANLSNVCQRLYANIAGPGVKLDDKNFPDFSQALEYSIRTPGKLCFEKLKSKSSFGKNPLMTYLRITLGTDEGNSPGVPFVMEIWPSKHKSPIHDHGDAYAVIKVLHGEINASYFTKLDKTSGVKLEPDFTFRKEAVTWISPHQYQVHQLHNDSDRVCVTIQCYQYPKKDRVHDEYFSFLEPDTGVTKPFYPGSDWDFILFKKLVKEEWEEHLKEAQWK